ncbi:hypothetical protein A5N86_09430 [Geobacillus thermoleovorans]|uniref:Uncharacterized protein n=2 Tax=Geobacillus TaxID=129337 RepID=Q5KV01_GEOKA|nr:hypothetical protein GA8_17690 [Geobacillus sp. A8]ESU70423.1 hypothetical protein T260_19145 [Geobacillus sp. MAS1]ODA17475.1 hypothetical protein A5N86_09430 [Geobacillus thermoleovorans]BAD77485.1 hypothetical protein GK3200 [Geobacillus kaustophilus HTA426]
MRMKKRKRRTAPHSLRRRAAFLFGGDEQNSPGAMRHPGVRCQWKPAARSVRPISPGGFAST